MLHSSRLEKFQTGMERIMYRNTFRLLPSIQSKLYSTKVNSQSHFPTRPERAELHAIGSAQEESGWLVKVWPKLKNIMAISSGIFATLIPKVQTM